MEKGLNLTVLEEYLTFGVPADVLANQLDELAFDYAIANLRLQQLDSEISLNEHAADFLSYLRDLRDTLRQCSEN